MTSYHKKNKLLLEIEKAKKSLVIVEGKKDKAALEELGFNNIVVLHHNGTSLYAVLDKIQGKECIILTDIDRKGKQYYAMLKRELIKKGVKINDGLRKALQIEKISHVEGLTSFIKNKYNCN